MWVCKRCTFENSLDALQCEVCGNLSDECWSCSVCTTLNPDTATACSSCNAKPKTIDVAPMQLREDPERRATEGLKKAKIELPRELPSVWSTAVAGGFVHGSFDLKKQVVKNEISIMCLNVWFDEAYFEQRVKAQLEVMQTMKPDVVCLQEVTPNYLRLVLENKWIQSSMWVSHKTVEGYGVTILSNCVPASFDEMALPSVMGRTLLTVQFDSNWPAISTVHLESLSDYQASRVSQLNLIGKKLAPLSDVILCGDFNFDADAATSIENKSLPKDFVDVMPKVPTLGLNYPSKKYGKTRFDRMLLKSSSWIRQTSNVFGEKRLPSSGPSPASDYLKSRGAFLSDHLGLFAKFCFKK